MATIRPGNSPVLMIVDVQVGVMRAAWNTEQVVRNIAHTLDRARAANAPVLWVQHSDTELIHGTPDWQWVPELIPRPAEPRIDKHFNSAFEQTPLDTLLATLHATHIILAGAATNWCIRATAHAALERGYDLTLVQDAHTTETMKLSEEVTLSAENLIHELNTAISYLTYPGRTNRTAKAAEVAFA